MPGIYPPLPMPVTQISPKCWFEGSEGVKVRGSGDRSPPTGSWAELLVGVGGNALRS